MNAGYVPGIVISTFNVLHHSFSLCDRYCLLPLPLDEVSLVIVLLWMGKLRLGIDDVPSGHIAEGEVRLAWASRLCRGEGRKPPSGGTGQQK